MALILADRVKESTTTTGTSDFVLGGAVTGFQTFADGVGVSNTTYYAVSQGSDWEVGLGTLSSDGLTLARTTVLQSSNSDTKVSFASGSKEVFVTYAADKAVFEDASGNVTLPANLTVTGGSITDSVQLDLTAGVTPAVGQIAWDANQGTASLGLLGGNVISRMGQSLVAYVTNAESVTITKGQAVYLFSAQGDRATVKLANNTGDSTSAKTLGIVAEDITANGTGFVVCQGVIYGLDLSAFTAGDTIYLGATAGALTATKPYAPNHLVYLGVVEKANAGAGQLYVRVQNGYELDEIHNVSAQSPSNGQTIVYNSSTSLWEKNTVSLTAGVNGTLPVANGGTGITTTPANGALDIGNGTGFTRTTLTAGTGISVTNGAGSITIANTASVAAATPTALGTVYAKTNNATAFETFLGYQAGNVSTGTNNTFIGYQAGLANTTAVQNTAIGYAALSSTTTNGYNVAVGYNALAANTSAFNVAIGANALQANITGTGIGIGYNALSSNTTGVSNIAVGNNALRTATTASYNTAIGLNALFSTTTATFNIAVGQSALYANTIGTNNTAVGYAALTGNTTGTDNTAVGFRALDANTTGSNNVAVGSNALGAATTAVQNTAIGWNSSLNITTGSSNTAIGLESLQTCTTGAQNTAFGAVALDQLTTGSNNVAVGYRAGDNVTTGQNNVFLGHSAGDITTGSNNVLIGYQAAASSATVSNENTFGSSSTTSNRFWGDFKMGGSSAGTSGQVLTSAGAGVSPTWTTPATPASGAYVFISSQTISTAVANVDFTSGFSTTYDNYVILLDSVTCSNQGTLGIRFYKDGVLASSSGYVQSGIKSSSTTVSAFVGTGDSYFQVFGGDNVEGSSSYVSGIFNLYSANSNTASLTFSANVSNTLSNITNKSATGGGRNTTTGSFTGIRFFWTAGYNFTAGTFKLYGIKKA